MRVLSARLFAFAFLCASFSFAANRLVAAEGDAAVMQVDRRFVQAAAKGDAAALGKMLDAEFTWTDAEGKTLTAEVVLRAGPRDGLGDESGAEGRGRAYGQGGAGKVGSGKGH